VGLSLSKALGKSDSMFKGLGALDPARGGIGGMSGSEFYDAMTGKTQSDAALEAAHIQSEAAEKARRRIRADFEPYRDIGQFGIEGYQSLADPAGQAGFINENPLYQSLLSASNEYSSPLGGLAGTDAALQDLYLAESNELIDREMNRYLPLIDIGGGSAARMAAKSADLLTSGASARAGGVIGKNMAEAQGIENMTQLGSAVGNYFANRPKKDTGFFSNTGSFDVDASGGMPNARADYAEGIV